MIKHVKLYTDTEYNSGGGKLLSAGMVSSCGQRWYEAVHLPEGEVVDFWPAKYVIPVLGKAQITREAMLASLAAFLAPFDMATLVIDNNSDANHFAKLFEDSQLTCLVKMEFVRPIQGVKHLSKVPHNALSDAHGLMEAVLGSTVVDARGVSPRSVYLQLEHLGMNAINSEFKFVELDAQGNTIVQVFPVRTSNRKTIDRWTDDYNHAIGSIFVTVPL